MFTDVSGVSFFPGQKIASDSEVAGHQTIWAVVKNFHNPSCQNSMNARALGFSWDCTLQGCVTAICSAIKQLRHFHHVPEACASLKGHGWEMYHNCQKFSGCTIDGFDGYNDTDAFMNGCDQISFPG